MLSNRPCGPKHPSPTAQLPFGVRLDSQFVDRKSACLGTILCSMNITSKIGIKVVTHNLCQGGRAGDGSSWQRLLSDLGADIVCAQETYHPQHYLMDEYGSFGGAVHQMVPHGKWGTAILSRHHTLEPLPVAEFDGWVVGARVHGVEVGGKIQDVDVYSVHIPSPGPYERRVDKLIDVLSSMPTDCLKIVAGDFNMTVSMRHDAEALKNTPGELRIQQRLCNELGLVNAWQTVNPNTPLTQTLRWARNKKAAYHCDGIFVDHRHLSSLRAATILDDEVWAKLSDHNPVMAALG